jgi:diaminopropionate ammonia-lyase
MEWIVNPRFSDKKLGSVPFFLDRTSAVKALTYHQTLPEYQATPLVHLRNLAHHLGLGAIYVKDESSRFGLKAFKVLGASYAVHFLLKRKARAVASPGDNRAVYDSTATYTFATATDGNHGKALAWAVRKYGQQAVIYMPYGSAEARVSAICEEGAKVKVTRYNYDETADMIAADAEENGWVLVQDSARPGYEKIPKIIMQGYLTMAEEIRFELKRQAEAMPTHVFLQAGVGSFPAALAGHWLWEHKESCPKIIIVEPDQAGCFYNSCKQGKKANVSGDFKTIMAGLACGSPSTVAWEILNRAASVFIICPDEITLHGMRLLSTPMKDDSEITSGESGAVCAGVLEAIMHKSEFGSLRRELGLDQDSRVLLFNTEGITNPPAGKE